MEFEERLAEIYIDAFSAQSKKKEKLVTRKKWSKHISNMSDIIWNARTERSLLNPIVEIKRDYYALSELPLSKDALRKRRKDLRVIVEALANREIEFLLKKYSEAEVDNFLERMYTRLEVAARIISVSEKYILVKSGHIEKQILGLVQTDPTVEFPKTREMNRHFHLHLGPTNSGKTYSSIQRLKEAAHGVYLGPLRLLALEIYDTLTEAGVPCSMLTGEEHIYVENAKVISQTIETVNITDEYDVAVIDEAQLIEDVSRGHAWSRAVLGVMAKEIYICASANVEKLLIGIIEACGDTYDVTYHERKTELAVESRYIKLSSELNSEIIQKGDCFIAFSKKAVLDLAARLEMAGFKASVIYGKLPPETRKREVARFTKGETEVVVATDAIGMGVNLPIRRIILTANMKYDGKESRPLRASEVLQIAGRAGRFGLYDRGYVTSTIPRYNNDLAKMLESKLPDVSSARLGFPAALLSLDDELDDIIMTWKSIKAQPPYEKIDTEEMITLYKTLKMSTRNFSEVPGGDDKATLYNMVSVPLDVKNPAVVGQWIYYCKNYVSGPSLEFPVLPRSKPGKELERYEDYYKLLDLYHMFSVHLGKELDDEKLRYEKRITEDKIEEILAGSKNDFLTRCMYCRKPLALGSRFRVCDDCYALR